MTDPIEDLRARRLVQEVPVDAKAIGRLLDDARLHLGTALRALEVEDLAGAYQLAYDAARKSLTAMLLSRGLRARGVAAHATLLQAVEAAFVAAPGIELLGPFDRMRQTRNQAEYVGRSFDREDVLHDLAASERIVGLAESILDRSA